MPASGIIFVTVTDLVRLPKNSFSILAHWQRAMARRGWKLCLTQRSRRRPWVFSGLCLPILQYLSPSTSNSIDSSMYRGSSSNWPGNFVRATPWKFQDKRRETILRWGSCQLFLFSWFFHDMFDHCDHCETLTAALVASWKYMGHAQGWETRSSGPLKQTWHRTQLLVFHTHFHITRGTH